MKRAEAEQIEHLRSEITQAKEEGRDVSSLARALIQLEKKPKPNKKPRVTTP